MTSAYGSLLQHKTRSLSVKPRVKDFATQATEVFRTSCCKRHKMSKTWTKSIANDYYRSGSPVGLQGENERSE